MLPLPDPRPSFGEYHVKASRYQRKSVLRLIEKLGPALTRRHPDVISPKYLSHKSAYLHHSQPFSYAALRAYRCGKIGRHVGGREQFTGVERDVDRSILDQFTACRPALQDEFVRLLKRPRIYLG